MLSPTRPDDLAYVDVATQTSPSTAPTSISPACPAYPVTSFLTATNLPNARLVAYKGDPSSVECMPPAEPHGPDSTPPRPTHTLIPNSLRPQQVRNIEKAGTRSVSLPDTLHDEGLRLMLSRLADSTESEDTKTSRVVSMPALTSISEARILPERHDNLEQHPQNLLTRELDADSSSSGVSSTPSTPGTIVVHSQSSELLDSPSPPLSSCDSVEFTLEDPALLPESFLRRSASPQDFVPAKSSNVATALEDDGWITWASSPPRPIPALHGPSSLPYARCPSGAEGTIIEEQSSMSRMIWGLDPNDASPTSNASPQQQSRAIPARVSGDIIRYGSVRAPSTIKPPSFPLPGIPRSSFGDTAYSRIQGHQSLRISGSRPDENSDGIFRGVKKEGTGLGFVPTDDHARSTSWNERAIHFGATGYPQFYRQHMPDPVDTADEMRSVDGDTWDRGRTARPAVNRGHPSDLIDLFSSPVKAPAYNVKQNTRISSTSQSAMDLSGYLMTPPNSTSPQWSSVFSPFNTRNNNFTSTNSVASGNDLSANYRSLSKMGTNNDDLSHELRRLFFENLSSSNSIDLRNPSTTQVSPVPSYPFARMSQSFVETPIHPPGIPAPNHLSHPQAPCPVDTLSGKGALSQSLTPPNPATSYKRSTLSNPSSIPLSRLRQNQNRGAEKLATVPEEDLEVPTHGRWLVLPLDDSRPSVRTPSPLTNQLQPQSVEVKTIVEDVHKAGTVRVKLPYIGELRAEVGSNQSTISRGTPRRKRMLRRKKPAIEKSTENKRGFPLVSEGTVSFGSSDANGLQGTRNDWGLPLENASQPNSRSYCRNPQSLDSNLILLK